MIAGYGVTEEAMGCPIIADMETSVLGVFDGVEVHCGAPATCPLLICLLDTDMMRTPQPKSPSIAMESS